MDKFRKRPKKTNKKSVKRQLQLTQGTHGNGRSGDEYEISFKKPNVQPLKNLEFEDEMREEPRMMFRFPSLLPGGMHGTWTAI